MAKMYYPLITSFMIFYLLSTECFGAVEPVLLAYTIDGRFYKQLGSSLAGVGDINGDGFDDIACGAAGYLIEKDSKGNGYIFWGRRTKFNGMPDIVMEGENFYDEFGYALCGPGDLNGDGYDDFVVGAWRNDSSNKEGGALYIYWGGAKMDNIADLVIEGVAPVTGLGVSVAGIGDINKDGFMDLAAGVTGPEDMVLIFLGGTHMDGEPDLILRADGDDFFGRAISKAGDTNFDGYDDFLIGAWHADSGLNREAGKAYLFFGGRKLDSVPDRVYSGEKAYDHFGISVEGGMDVNGNMIPDIIIGAFHADNVNAVNSGCSYIVFDPGMNGLTKQYRLDGDFNQEFFGCSVAMLGDINHDGFGDFMVGAMGYNNYMGRALIFLGNSVSKPCAGWCLEGESDHNFFGLTVASAGDVNRNGNQDFLISATGYSDKAPMGGKVYLFSFK